MNEIKAFVGHSFTEADEEVVGKFTKYFDSLAHSHPQFSWQSAERAEPRILTEKVLRIIADKNTFIGICTRKEKVVRAAGVSPLFFLRGFVKVRESELVWKTSDWIIQEIGMAIGRNLNVILLVEEGVRDPGGLQGDIEYISFNRDHPERAFNKILEMLSTLSPKHSTQLAVVADFRPPEEEVAKPSNDDYLGTPDATWNRRRYEMAALSAVGMEAEERLKVISDAYKTSGHASSDDNLVTWDAWIEYLRIYVGKGGKIDRLREMAERNPASSKTISYVARAYGLFEQHGLSAQTYMRALAAAESAERRAEYAQNAARQFALSKQPEKASEAINALRALMPQTPSAEVKLINSLIDVAEQENSKVAELALLERLIELKPDDYNIRFNVAYKHSDQGSEELAVYHYLMIPYSERSAIAWNNLGASLDQLKLSAKAVDAYERASEMGETLAMSNLGNKFMSAGFVKEAQANCDKAIATGNPHKNVGHLLTALKELPEEEETKQKELLDRAKPRVAFLQQLGVATASNEPENLGESWQGPHCVLNFHREGRLVRFAGTYEQVNSLVGLLGALGAPPSPTKLKYTVVYSGTLRGRAIFGTVDRKQEGATIAGSSAVHSKALMYFSEDGGELVVMEGPIQTIRPMFIFDESSSYQRS